MVHAGAICTRSGCGRLKAPFVWPGGVVVGSLTVSAASPAVLITFAVVVAVYSRATPGVNVPNEAGAPEGEGERRGHVPPARPVV